MSIVDLEILLNIQKRLCDSSFVISSKVIDESTGSEVLSDYVKQDFFKSLHHEITTSVLEGIIDNDINDRNSVTLVSAFKQVLLHTKALKLGLTHNQTLTVLNAFERLCPILTLDDCVEITTVLAELGVNSGLISLVLATHNTKQVSRIKHQIQDIVSLYNDVLKNLEFYLS